MCALKSTGVKAFTKVDVNVNGSFKTKMFYNKLLSLLILEE